VNAGAELGCMMMMTANEYVNVKWYPEGDVTVSYTE
jgi:hypothetical protein